jgi:hypothetical protein
MVYAAVSSKLKSALVIKAQLPPTAAQLFLGITKAAPEPYHPKQCPPKQGSGQALLQKGNNGNAYAL